MKYLFILIAGLLIVGCNAKQKPQYDYFVSGNDTIKVTYYNGSNIDAGSVSVSGGWTKDSIWITKFNRHDTVYVHDTTLINSFAMHNEILQNTFHEGFNQGAISAMKLVDQNRYSYKNIMKEYRQDSINFYNAIIKPLE